MEDGVKGRRRGAGKLYEGRRKGEKETLWRLYGAVGCGKVENGTLVRERG